MRERLAKQPDLTLKELAERSQCNWGIHACLSLVCRVLQNSGYLEKRRAMDKAKQARQAYCDGIACLQAERFKFVENPR